MAGSACFRGPTYRSVKWWRNSIMSRLELISAEELTDALQPALLKAIERLAPLGSNRSVPVNVFCDVMIDMIATLLTVTVRPDTPAEIERLAGVFREKLLVATGLHNLHLHINHTPALGGNSSIHGFAGRWWLELLAILAALVALRSVLVLH